MAKTSRSSDTAANLGFEAKLWQMADGLRNNMDAAEYKHVVLGLWRPVLHCRRIRFNWAAAC